MVPPELETFGHAVAQQLEGVLGDELVGAYFVGSVAMGGYVSNESDVDIVAACEHAIPDQRKAEVASRVLEEAARCPTRGLEFTLYRRQVATSPPQGADFEVNVNGGPRMERLVRRTAEHEPAFWYVLDRAIAHRYGVAILGPPAADLFVDPPRPVLLDMLGGSLRWHRQHERATHYSVLNAARAWRFAADDVLGSKLDGARWVGLRWQNRSMIDAAVKLRHGRVAVLNKDEVDQFLAHVDAVIAAAT